MAEITLRRGTAATAASSNPTLAEGEPGYEVDTGRLKIGDGSTAWNSLPYFTRAVVAKTAAYTAAVSDRGVLCDATSAAFTVTLPAVADATDVKLFVKKTDSSGNAITIDGNASETIDGATTQTLSTQYDCLTLYCDGTEWWVID